MSGKLRRVIEKSWKLGNRAKYHGKGIEFDPNFFFKFDKSVQPYMHVTNTRNKGSSMCFHVYQLKYAK